MLTEEKRTIRFIVIHCADTDPRKPYPFETCRRDHIMHNKWSDIGYHYYITTDGTIHPGRSEDTIGAHVKGFNKCSIGVCYEGGKFGDSRTIPQKESLVNLLRDLRTRYPDAAIVGHHDLNPSKQCPSFDARHEYKYI